MFLNIAGVLEALQALPLPAAFRRVRSFCPPFSVFRFGRSLSVPAELPAPCWLTVATVYPPGNCDSLKLGNQLELLDSARNRFVFLAAQFLFALLDSARTLPEELVNYASASSRAAEL